MATLPLYTLDHYQTHDLLFVTNIHENIIQWLNASINFPIVIPQYVGIYYFGTSGLLLFENTFIDNDWCNNYIDKLFNFYKLISTTGQYDNPAFNGNNLIGFTNQDNYGNKLINTLTNHYLPFPYEEINTIEIVNNTQDEITIRYFRDAFDDISIQINYNEVLNIDTNTLGRIFMIDTIKIKPNKKRKITQPLIGSVTILGNNISSIESQINPHLLYKNLYDVLIVLADLINLSYPKIGKYLHKINYKIGSAVTFDIQNYRPKINNDYLFNILSIELLDCPDWYHYASLVKHNDVIQGTPITLKYESNIIKYSNGNNISNSYSEEHKHITEEVGFLTNSYTFRVDTQTYSSIIYSGINEDFFNYSRFSSFDNIIYFENFTSFKNIALFSNTDPNLIKIEKHCFLWVSPRVVSEMTPDLLNFGTWDVTTNYYMISDFEYIILDREQKKAYFETQSKNENVIGTTHARYFYVSDVTTYARTLIPCNDSDLIGVGLEIDRSPKLFGYEYTSDFMTLTDSLFHTERLEFQGSIEFIPWQNEPLSQNETIIDKTSIDAHFSKLSSNGESENTNMPDSQRVKRIYQLLGGDDWDYTETSPTIELDTESLLKGSVTSQYGVNEENAASPKTIKSQGLTGLLINVLGNLFFRLGLNGFPIKRPSLLTDKIEEMKDEDIQNLLALDTWYHKNFDAIMGKFPIKIKFTDSDLVDAGDETIYQEYPNLAETLAELQGMMLRSYSYDDFIINTILKILMESSSNKTVDIKTNYMVQAILDYLGCKLSHKEIEVMFMCNPLLGQISSNIGHNFHDGIDDSASEFTKPTKIKVKIEELDQQYTLEQQIHELLKSGAVIRGRHGRKLGLTSKDWIQSIKDKKDMLNKYYKNIKNANAHQPEGQPTNTDDFDIFLEETEKGFTDEPGYPHPSSGNEEPNPYSRPYTHRPQINRIIAPIEGDLHSPPQMPETT